MALVCEKKEITLSYKDDKPKVFRLFPVKQQQVTFDKLLDEISSSCGVGRAQVKATVEGLIDRMTMFMDYGMSVKLGDFGSFKPSINSKSEATAKELDAENVIRKKILFYPGKRFKEMLGNISVTTLSDGAADTGSDESGSTPDTPGGSGGGSTDFE